VDAELREVRSVTYRTFVELGRVRRTRQRPDDERLLFHCLVPAAHWWDDIVFT
jgi:hypothetical protein